MALCPARLYKRGRIAALPEFFGQINLGERGVVRFIKPNQNENICIFILID
jgi:hypothetical protein